jgi:hypothetical protein
MKEQIKMVKKISRKLFPLKVTKIKPSAKLYSRKKGKDSNQGSSSIFIPFPS